MQVYNIQIKYYLDVRQNYDVASLRCHISFIFCHNLIDIFSYYFNRAGCIINFNIIRFKTKISFCLCFTNNSIISISITYYYHFYNSKARYNRRQCKVICSKFSILIPSAFVLLNVLSDFNILQVLMQSLLANSNLGYSTPLLLHRIE